jgi:hypothetical protein
MSAEEVIGDVAKVDHGLVVPRIDGVRVVPNHANRRRLTSATTRAVGRFPIVPRVVTVVNGVTGCEVNICRPLFPTIELAPVVSPAVVRQGVAA